MRLYDVRQDCFDKITLESCYWGGFFAADGNIASTSRDANKLSLELQTRDIDHLRQFRDFVGFDGPIRQTKCNTARIEIYSKNIKERLESVFNIVPRKSLILQPPNLLEQNFILAYIVGYLDGDGSIFWFDNNKRLGVSFDGSKYLLDWIKYYIDLLVPYKTISNVRKAHNAKSYQYTITGKRAYHVIDLLMTITVPRLVRKWNKR